MSPAVDKSVDLTLEPEHLPIYPPLEKSAFVLTAPPMPSLYWTVSAFWGAAVADIAAPPWHTISHGRWARSDHQQMDYICSGQCGRSFEAVDLLRIVAEDRVTLGFSHADLDGEPRVIVVP